MMMTLAMLLLILPAFPFVGPDAEASPAPLFFANAEGGWRGHGELFGAATTFEMRWEMELGGRFARLTYVIKGTRPMDAVAHYRIRDEGPLDGAWFDSRGEIVDLSATATDSMLATEWRSPSERGRTSYRLTPSGGLEVEDYYFDGSDYRLFGRATYSRAGADESG